MIVRFQADADFNQIILLGTIRREPAIDFQTAVAAGLEGLNDEQVLTTAATKSAAQPIGSQAARIDCPDTDSIG